MKSYCSGRQLLYLVPFDARNRVRKEAIVQPAESFEFLFYNLTNNIEMIIDYWQYWIPGDWHRRTSLGSCPVRNPCASACHGRDRRSFPPSSNAVFLSFSRSNSQLEVNFRVRNGATTAGNWNVDHTFSSNLYVSALHCQHTAYDGRAIQCCSTNCNTYHSELCTLSR